MNEQVVAIFCICEEVDKYSGLTGSTMQNEHKRINDFCNFKGFMLKVILFILPYFMGLHLARKESFKALF